MRWCSTGVFSDGCDNAKLLSSLCRKLPNLTVQVERFELGSSVLPLTSGEWSESTHRTPPTGCGDSVDQTWATRLGTRSLADPRWVGLDPGISEVNSPQTPASGAAGRPLRFAVDYLPLPGTV